MPAEKIARYEIVQELGKGAMGVVYKAIDPTIGRTLALKTMRLDVHGMEASEMLQRFKNEARAAGLLNHPNIVTIYDAGEWEGLFYIAMEFIEGISLQQRIKMSRLTVEEIVDLTTQICAGLDYAHAKGVIHRDVKPANIMLAGPFVKVMDFGIAKAGGATMTGTGQVLGTPNYMAPEQVRGKPLDGRSDLFSLGVMLYEMVTGERPFTGENVTTIVYKIVHESPPAPRDLDVTVHPGLSSVVLKSLEKAPDLRYQTGAEMAQALHSYKSFGAETTGPTMVLDAAAFESPPVVAGSQTGTHPGAASSSITTSATIRAAEAAAAAATRQTAPHPPAAHHPPAAVVPQSHETVAIAPPDALSKAHPPARPPMPKPVPKGAKPGLPLPVLAGIAVLAVALFAAGYWKLHHRSAPEPTPQVQQQPVASSQTPAAGTQPPAQAATQPATEEKKPAENAGNATDQAAAQPAATTPAAEEAKPAEVPTTGDLRVTSKPEGAAITLDGRHNAKWITPFNFSQLKPGSHKIAVALEGYAEQNRGIEVTAGKRAAGNFELVANKGYVQIASDPAGAAIFVDGQPSGQVTPGKVTLDPGQHRVGIRLEGYKPEQAIVDVGAGQTLSLSPKMAHQQQAQTPAEQPAKAAEKPAAGTAAANEAPFDAPQQPAGNPFGRMRRFFAGIPAGKGMIEIRTKPKGAEVFVNRFAVPMKTPFRLPIRPGTYTVTIRMPGFKPAQQKVEVTEGNVLPLEVQLEKAK